MKMVAYLVALSCAAVSLPVAAQEDPKWLSKQEVEATLSGKIVRFTRPRDGNTIRWDIRSDGSIYHSNQTRPGGGTSVSGNWEAREDGGFCAKFRDDPTGAGTCTYYYLDDGNLKRTFARTPESVPSAVSIEFVK